MAPANLKYTTTHEWVGLEGTKARFGLTDFAVKEIKDIVYLDLPPAGTAVKAGTAFGAVETVKAAFDLNAPVSGKISAVNTAAVASADSIIKDPFGAGWLVEVETGDTTVTGGEMAALMDTAAYGAFCAKGGHH
jgi:glycine cleavage system H protein